MMKEGKKSLDYNSKVNAFVKKVKSRKVDGSFAAAMQTVTLLKRLIKETNWKTAQTLITILTTHGKTLTEALPVHASVGNMVRRVLKIVREEYTAARKNKQEEIDPQDSLHKIVTGEGDVDDYTIEVPELKSAILDHISEFQVELETSAENIANQGKEHIHSNEIIMTIGRSRTVEAYLKKAAEDRKFEVIVVECAPFCHGHDLAISLAENKIQTTLIPDSAVFGIMSRVNKVIIGTHTVMANGGLRAVCGSHSAALAAKHYSVPVIVLAPLYKLSPQYLCSYAHETFNSFVSPEGVLHYSDGDILSSVHVYNPVFDYVPPELVTLFISNTGGHAPSYVYRLLSELYHPDDNF
ncbi:eukaryotic translation initiation factor 2B subunit beta isoform X1 [Lycorma delicatula]|uniref:eukaryotic translation initiation factor 2B subunit beta isoform X1 n=1 Tax=Lycorma delicatula TaxID=130591 RepID=UPI003F513F53